MRQIQQKKEIKYENISKLSEESVNKFYKYYKFKMLID